MPSILEPTTDEVLQMCYKHTGLFGKTFKPEAFAAKFSSLHKDMLDAIDGPDQLVAIAAPRGLGKTTTVRTYCEKRIMYRDVDFLVYVSNSETVAELQTENSKRELRTNSELRKMFGDIQINDTDPDFDETFSKRAWVAFGKTLVLPRGAQQQIRGLIYKRYRPQVIVIDDLEKREELENPENRRKLKEWFYADLMKCVDRYTKDWKIIYIDTLKHSDSLLAELLEDPEWRSIRLDICDDDYHSNVPELFTDEELKKEAASHRRNGTLDIFFMEYRNIPTSKEDASFKQEYFKQYEEPTLDVQIKRRLENLIIVDPAKTVRMQSADSAIVGVGIDYVGGGWYVRDIVHGKMYPDELYNEMFAMRKRLNAHAIGIEVTGLEEFIKQPILNEMQRRGPGNVFEPVWLIARGGMVDERSKLRRIGALVPYYRQGFIYHNMQCGGALESQLIAFPRGKLVDIADALAYVIEMLEIGQRYFNHPDDDDDDNEALEAEFAEIEYDEPLGDEYLRI